MSEATDKLEPKPRDADARVWFAPGTKIPPQQIVVQSLNHLLTADVVILGGCVAEINFSFAKEP